jgi:hypothetical protein
LRGNRVVAIGLTLALLLMALGAGTAYRQVATRRRLRDERFLPGDERSYLSGQVRRRVVVGIALVAVGGMIAGYYLSGMDARMDEIKDRRDNLVPADNAGRPADVDPADKQFAKLVISYWIGILCLVFVIACAAILDFWATRKYWMAQYRVIKEDHEAKLRRDLAVYRQAKDNDRMSGLGKKPEDETDENPPVE